MPTIFSAIYSVDTMTKLNPRSREPCLVLKVTVFNMSLPNLQKIIRETLSSSSQFEKRPVFQVSSGWFNLLAAFVSEWNESGVEPSSRPPNIEVGLAGDKEVEFVPRDYWSLLVETFGFDGNPIPGVALKEKFSCGQCDSYFTSRNGLKFHVKSIHKKITIDCHLCGLPFNQPGHLKIHMDSHHNQVTYQCQVCNKAYPSAGNLNRHVRHAHGQNQIAPSPLVEDPLEIAATSSPQDSTM